MSNDEISNEETNVKNEGTSADDMKDVEDSKSDDDANKDVKKDSDGDAEMKGESSEEKEDEEEKKKKEEELRKKYADWPLKGIKEPHENDVMYGRGGGTNHHPGNKMYRQLVEDRKLEYVNSKRLDKPLVALEIIRSWRGQIPPGRFLKLDDKTGTWLDVGDKKAREKTSQALREKAPLIRKQQEEQEEEEKHKDEESETSEVGKASNQSNDTKSTRFAEGTKTESNQAKKPVLARDHSLGREYLQAGEQVSLEGFSWQDPFQSNNSKKKKPYTSSHPSPPPPPPHEAAACPPAGRNSSHGSLGMAPPHHTSVGGPPPPPDYWGRVPSDDRQRQYSSSRIESWGAPYPYPPPPPPGIQGATHQRSGSWTHPPPTHGPRRQRSGSWSGAREHSLSHNPLHNASVTQPADQRAFDSNRSSSGYWGEPIPPPPPPGPYGSGPRLSNGSMGSYRLPSSPSHSFSPANSTPSPKPPYSVDESIAKTWSGGEVRRTWSGEQPHEMRQAWPNEYEYEGQPRPVPGGDASPFRAGTSSTVPRPHIVKRDTSNQNENYETKPSVKRAALNRDNSLASNRLKNQYMPENYNFDTEHEMKNLSNNFEHSTLSSASKGKDRPKPRPMGEDGRVSTIDAISMDLMAKPQRLLLGDRDSTLDALDIDFDDDPIIRPEEMMREQSKEDEKNKDLPKPKSLAPDNRLTTQDFLDLVTSPIVEDDVPLSKSDEASGGDPVYLNEEKIAEEWLTQV